MFFIDSQNFLLTKKNRNDIFSKIQVFLGMVFFKTKTNNINKFKLNLIYFNVINFHGDQIR